MILDLDGKTLVVRIERWSLSYRPGSEHPIKLKPKIEMQSARVMLLDDEAAAVRRLQRRPAARLLRLLEVALLLGREFVARHGSSRYTSASRVE
jgi:hypothetical protein